MERKRKKKSIIPVMIAALAALCFRADACVLFYAGGDMTDDGANMFMRSEELEADSNKTYYVSSEGKHKAGETYQGCTEFTWTFTHDSYEYTARCYGKDSGVCLNCGSGHDHTPYEEAGTNDHGVTVSATQSLNANPGIKKADPFTENGIEESEMATVLLSESANAREGVELASFNLRKMQGEFVSRFGKIYAQIKAEPSLDARKEIMTRADMDMAEQVHDMALALYRFFVYGEASDLIEAPD